MIKYSFFLSNGSVTRQAYPVYKDDLALEYAFEQGQMFRRKTLSGSIVFVGDDYSFIMSQSFDTLLYLDIKVQWTEQGTVYDYWKGWFYQADCTVNVDDMKVSVKPTVYDRYNKILAGLEKEYDLIKLNPAIQPVNLTRRPMIQLYAAGDSVVSCFLAGMQWEQDANNETNDGKLRNDYHFAKVDVYAEIQFTNNPPVGLQGVFIGTYPQTAATGEWRIFENEEQMYYISYFQSTRWVEEQCEYTNGLRVYSYSDPNNELWELRQSQWSTDPDGDYKPIPSDLTLRSERTGVADLTGQTIETAVYGRWVCAGDTFGGHSTYTIPEGDIVPNNRNYRYCYPVTGNDIVQMSYRCQNDPTQWGVRPDGKYFLKPEITSVNTLDYFPMSRSTWGYASIWFRYTAEINNEEPLGRKATPLHDAFTLEAVISALLSQIDPYITFGATSAYSEILYGSTPLTNYFGRLAMTPKSNVLVAEYTQPARKAPITLGEVFDMLQNTMACYWFVDDSNRLRIEHISWFKNGGSYNGSPSVGINLIAMQNSRNGKSWSFATGEYNFDKIQMPERYQFRWMDDTTTIFKGEPIEVVSGYVQEGNIEEITVAKFNSDVDYMMLNPSNVSQDGFALLCCTIQSGNWNVTLEQMMLTPYKFQNWQLAFYSLQQWFLTYDMPAWSIKVNGSATTAKGIQRMKKQQVDVPLNGADPNFSQLVRTTVGDGEIEKASIRLTSRMAKCTLRFDTISNSSPVPPVSIFDEVFATMRTVIDSNMVGSVPVNGSTYTYMQNMYSYAETYSGQFYDISLFDMVKHQTGTLISDTNRAKKAQTGWLMAMCLAEICPNIANDLYHAAYGIIGTIDNQHAWGYNINSDANIARIVASICYALHRYDAAVYEAAARRELAEQDITQILGTTRGEYIPDDYDQCMADLPDGTQFMPSTPINSYANPDFAFDEATWEDVYTDFYYENGAYHDPPGKTGRAQMAVEDSERTTVAAQKQMYADVGVVMSSAEENLITPCYMWGGRITYSMKDGYDSITQTYMAGSGDTPRTDSEFRMRPFQFHDAHLLDPNDDGSGYINTSSYPSGHSAFGWNIALMMIETHGEDLIDVKKIIARAFQFGQSRTIGRYHWQADVLHGMVVSTAVLPRLHSYQEYLNLLALT